MPLAEAVELLADDHDGYVPPMALALTLVAEAEAPEGPLLMRGTVDVDVAAIIGLWRVTGGKCGDARTLPIVYTRILN